MFGKQLSLIVLVVLLFLVTGVWADGLADLDPNLIGWWRFEEGAGTEAIDESGNGFHGTLMGDPIWSPGYEGLALDLDGLDDYVETGKLPSELGLAGNGDKTVSLWVYTRSFNGGGLYEMGGQAPGEGFWLGTTTTDNVWHFSRESGETTFRADSLNEWTHVTHTHWGYGKSLVYINGIEVVRTWGHVDTIDEKALRIGVYGQAYFDGRIDNVRLYNTAVEDDQIPQIARGDVALAWNPKPAYRATVDLDGALLLHWSAGADAVAHDIYFGTDRTAVNEATVATPGIYRGRQSQEAATYTIPEAPLQWNATYYWRVDEVDASGRITKGSLWSFTTADYLIIDDFESYTEDYEVGETIWQTWIDGFDDPNNGNSYVGYDPCPPFPVPPIVHSGLQVMPLYYDNSQSPWYSQVTRTWATPQDWTRYGVDTLTLYLTGGWGWEDNSPDRLYVAVSDTEGDYLEVAHPNREIARTGDWERWDIPLETFSAVVVDVTNVSSLTIGVGDPNDPTTGSSGLMLFDDIRLTRSESVPDPNTQR